LIRYWKIVDCGTKEEIGDLFSTDTYRMELVLEEEEDCKWIILRRMGWEELEAHRGETRNYTESLLEKLVERGQFRQVVK
jgi:hypothetical protein